MNFCGFEIDAAAQAAIFGFALTLASEIIGMSKLRENSLLQLALGLLRNRVTSITPVQAPDPTPRTDNQGEPSPAKRRPGRPRGSTSARSGRAKASQ